MTLSSGIVILLLTGVSVLSAGLIVGLLTRYNSTRRQTARILMRESEASTVFLFDGDMLTDATASARQLLGRKDPRVSDLDAVMALLVRRFPDVRERLSSLPGSGRVLVAAAEQSGVIEAEYWDGLMRLTVRHQTCDIAPMQRLAIEAIEDELQTLRSIGEDAPQLIWKQDDAGTITWANRAYLNLADRISPIPEGGEPQCHRASYFLKPALWLIWPSRMFAAIPCMCPDCRKSSGSRSPVCPADWKSCISQWMRMASCGQSRRRKLLSKP